MNVSGGVILHKSEFRLRSALADLVKRVASEAEERGCRLRVRVEQDVVDALEGDVERLKLLLKNILDNAFQLVHGAEVTLTFPRRQRIAKEKGLVDEQERIAANDG